MSFAISAFFLTIFVGGVLLVRHVFPAIPYKEDVPKFWNHFETVGIPSSAVLPALAQFRGLISSLTATQRNAQEGYDKFSKAQDPRPFCLPTIWTWGRVVVLPQSFLHVLNKPDSEVRAFEAQLETIQLPYMISDRDVYTKVLHFDVVRKHMVNSKDVELLAPATAGEVRLAFNDGWGDDREKWKTLNAWDACGRVITRAATRVLIGLPMCHDETLFEQTRLFSDAVMMGTAMINCLPPIIRPVLGPVVALRAKYYQARCLKILVPFVSDRIQTWMRTNNKDGLPIDFLQWMIEKCAKEGYEEMEPVRLATRLLALNTMFIIGMAYVFAHCVLDIFGSASRDEIVAKLRTECRLVLERYEQDDGLLISHDAVSSIPKVDSAIRESMRISDIAITALARDVVSKQGLDLGNGTYLQKGTRIVFPTYHIHRDPSSYSGTDPRQFDAFRFSRRYEGLEHDAERYQQPREVMDATGRSHVNVTSITPDFLAWGYGKHSCPGRWFASQTMKQALVYILTNYDVEVVGETSERKVLLNTMLPRTDAKIRVRRRARS